MTPRQHIILGVIFVLVAIALPLVREPAGFADMRNLILTPVALAAANFLMALVGIVRARRRDRKPG